MKVSLKKFSQDPYQLVKKAPIILTIDDKKRYIIIPYETYMFNRETNVLQQDNTVTESPQTQLSHTHAPKKPHGRLWNLLFG